MNKIITAIGIAFVVIAIVYLIKPSVMKRMIHFFKQGKRIYFAGLIRISLAVVFLLSARECKQFWVIFAFGVLFLISGLLIFILGPEKLKRMFDWYQKQSFLLFRIVALIILIIGAIIIYSA